jgi:hypothetical protein
MTLASYRRLARLHGQRGCRNIKKVSRSADRSIGQSEGHSDGDFAAVPAVIE